MKIDEPPHQRTADRRTLVRIARAEDGHGLYLPEVVHQHIVSDRRRSCALPPQLASERGDYSRRKSAIQPLARRRPKNQGRGKACRRAVSSGINSRT